MTEADRPLAAALQALIILQLVMLFALFAKVQPHPPEATPLFGIGPFIGASIAVAGAALILRPMNGIAGTTMCVLAAILALVSFGPQKYLDPQFSLIWPAVITGQVAALTIAWRLITLRRA